MRYLSIRYCGKLGISGSGAGPVLGIDGLTGTTGAGSGSIGTGSGSGNEGTGIGSTGTGSVIDGTGIGAIVEAPIPGISGGGAMSLIGGTPLAPESEEPWEITITLDT